MFLLFKLKPFDMRGQQIMADKKLSKAEAEKHVKKIRASLPGNVKDDFIYMKLFKNIPQTDIEMVFPTTRVKFRMFDKVKLGVTRRRRYGCWRVWNCRQESQLAAWRRPIRWRWLARSQRWAASRSAKA